MVIRIAATRHVETVVSHPCKNANTYINVDDELGEGNRKIIHNTPYVLPRLHHF